MDPRELAENLVKWAPSGKGGEPHRIEITGLQQMAGAYATDAEHDAAVNAFLDRLEELTGYRAPRDFVHPAPKPAESDIAPPPAMSLEDMARAVIADTFSAPFDGSEERLEVFATRAMGNIAGFVENGLDPAICKSIIAELKEELRNDWKKYRG